MTLAKQREKLIFDIAWAMAEWSGDLKARAFDELPPYLQKMYLAGGEAIASAISAAGFSIVGPEVTEEMLDAWSMSDDAPISEFKAMLAAGDLARKPE